MIRPNIAREIYSLVNALKIYYLKKIANYIADENDIILHIAQRIPPALKDFCNYFYGAYKMF